MTYDDCDIPSRAIKYPLNSNKNSTADHTMGNIIRLKIHTYV